jgi:hypothetical protein
MGRPNPKAVGEKSEGQVLAALLRADKVVLHPFGDNQRYDFVIDEEGVFKRLQCKTARLRKGVLRFNAASTHSNSTEPRQGYRGQIEAFAVYSPDLDKVYIVPVEDVAQVDGSLRVDPVKNGQAKRIRFASDYELKGV